MGWKVFETFKNIETYQAQLASEFVQSPVVTPVEQTDSRECPAETKL
jgi:hypothetical protein